MPNVGPGRILVLDVQAVAAALSHMPNQDPCLDPTGLRRTAETAIDRSLSPEEKTAFSQFANGMYPWLVIRTGMDLSGLPQTPVDFSPVDDPSWWPLGWFTVGLMSLAGARLVSYACENGGKAFVNLVARPAADVGAGAAERSTKSMRGHTDGASFPFPTEYARGGEDHSPAPDLLVLVGLRNAEGTATRLAPASTALAALSDAELDAMEGPWFDISPQRTFEIDGIRVGAPILSRDEPRHGISVRFSHSNVTVTDGAPLEAEAALARFVDVLPEIYEDVVIGPGDVCLVHNRQVIHGRSATGPGVRGATRWLLRTYGWMDDTAGKSLPGGATHVHV